MTKPSDKPSNPSRPLWVIAIALVAIAVCLVILVVRIQHEPNRRAGTDTSPAKTAVREENREHSSKPSNFFRAARRGQSTAEPESREPFNSAAVSGLDASAATIPEDAMPTAGGILAPAAVPVNTNFISAIVGRVTLRGAPPPEAPIDMSRVPPCARAQTNAPTTRNFIVGPDGGLANVVVSVVGGLEKKNYALPATSFELSFANCFIHPYVSAVMVGQKVTVLNSDRMLHTIRMTATNNPPVNYNLSTKSPNATLTFRRPENLLRLQCDAHAWEFAYISVVEHPFFAVTDTNGSYVIPNLPAGRYTVRALHRKGQSTNELTREITVHNGEITILNFALDAPTTNTLEPASSQSVASGAPVSDPARR